MILNALGTDTEIHTKGGHGRGLFLLHGWKCSAQMMGFIQDRFADSMRTAAIDFPGHGKLGAAKEPPEPWGVPEYAALVQKAIEELDLAPCDIIAHSFGCRVAIYLASEHPELIGRMILTGAAGIRKPPDKRASARQKAYKTMRKALDVAGKTHLMDRQVSQWKEKLVQTFGSEDYKALTPEMRKTFNKVIGLDLTDRLPLVQAPTLLYWGAQDTETPLWMGKMMEEKIPDAGLIVEEGTGHFAYLERSDAFLRIASSFLLEGREAE